MPKVRDYPAEIARVEKAVATTKSDYLRRDYEKYLKRLKHEYANYLRWTKAC